MRIAPDTSVLVPVTVVTAPEASRPVSLVLRSLCPDPRRAFVWLTVDEAVQLRRDLKDAVLDVRRAQAAAEAAAASQEDEFSGFPAGGIDPKAAGHLPPPSASSGGDLFAGRRGK